MLVPKVMHVAYLYGHSTEAPIKTLWLDIITDSAYKIMQIDIDLDPHKGHHHGPDTNI